MPSTQASIRRRRAARDPGPRLRGMVLACCGLMAFAGSPAGRAAEAPPRRLVVVTHVAPPFVMRTGDDWSGISIDLWRRIAEDLHVSYKLRAVDSPEAVVDAVASGRADLAAAAITVTAERDRKVDFSQPYFSSGLAIAVPSSEKSGWLAVLQTLFSWEFLSVVAGLAVMLGAAAAGVWLCERRANPEQFGGPGARGFGSAFWWSAVTMTTVGYGDKAPRTAGGRAIAVAWMFASIVMVSSFTAHITSSLTVNRFESGIRGPADLARLTVATVADSSAAAFLRSQDIRLVLVGSLSDALSAVEAGRAQACVYDAPLLKYTIPQHPGLVVLPGTFEQRSYAIALPLGSSLRKAVNLSLLRYIHSDSWRRLEAGYLGRQ